MHLVNHCDQIQSTMCSRLQANIPLFIKFSSFITCVLLATQQIVAAPHIHCDVKPWSQTINHVVSYDNTFQEIFLLDVEPPDPTFPNPNCHYEVSDITSVELTMTFTGDPYFFATNVNFSNADNSINFDKGAQAFNNGVPTTINLFPHTQTADFATQLPNAGVYIDVEMHPISMGNVNITNISAKFRGNHYYVNPEPSSFCIMALGALGLMAYRRRSAKRARLNAGIVDS